MASDIIAESGAVYLHKIRQESDLYVMECEAGRGQGISPWLAAIDMSRSIDNHIAELKRDMISTLEQYTDAHPKDDEDYNLD